MSGCCSSWKRRFLFQTTKPIKADSESRWWCWLLSTRRWTRSWTTSWTGSGLGGEQGGGRACGRGGGRGAENGDSFSQPPKPIRANNETCSTSVEAPATQIPSTQIRFKQTEAGERKHKSRCWSSANIGALNWGGKSFKNIGRIVYLKKLGKSLSKILGKSLSKILGESLSKILGPGIFRNIQRN